MSYMKRCTKCNRLLPTDKFHICRTSKDGLQGYCKECKSAYAKKDHHKKAHKKIIDNLVKLRSYKLKGLQYEFIGKRKNHSSRKISYVCQNCGRTHVSSLDNALQNKFICDHCTAKETIPLFKPNHETQSNVVASNPQKPKLMGKFLNVFHCIFRKKEHKELVIPKSDLKSFSVKDDKIVIKYEE